MIINYLGIILGNIIILEAGAGAEAGVGASL